MPSLRQKVTTYFRQLSFIAEPRDGHRQHHHHHHNHQQENEDDNNFIIKYLEGRMERIFAPGPEIYNGENPTDLPSMKIGTYTTDANAIIAACTGPDEGLTGIKRSKLHLSASFADDIDFIDTNQDNDIYEVRKSITNNRMTHSKFNRGGKLGTTATTVNDQNANKTVSGGGIGGGAGGAGMRSRKNSRTSISNLTTMPNKDTTTTGTQAAAAAAAAAKQNTNVSAKNVDNANKSTTIVVSMISTKTKGPLTNINDQNNKNLLNDEKTDLIAVNETQTTIRAPSPANKMNTEIATTKTKTLLEKTTECLLHEAVSNQQLENCNISETIAGVGNWKMECESAYGISVSLYENNLLTKEPVGNPIADCYGIFVKGNAAAMALADGVNWGDGARLAARSAVHGCLDYLNRAIFGIAQQCTALTSQDVFVSLLRALWEGHGCILEVGGALSTLTIAIVLPLQIENIENTDNLENAEKYVVCACNVGDSLGYVYSKKYGVREFTQASHDITTMRDMRDALGALGPADGNKPELSNLTFSMTIIDKGDIVFLTSDGVSDNFDPVVGKFAEAWTPDVKLMSSNTKHGGGHHGVLAPKRQNKSASAIYARLHRNDVNKAATLQQPVRPPRSKKPSSSSASPPPMSAMPSEYHGSSTHTAPSRPKYMRSHTVIESTTPLSSSGGNATAMRHLNSVPIPKIPKSISGLPLVTGPQRHALTLHRLEDLLSYGINGTLSPCVSARRLCHLLIDFVRMITSARRKTLEQRELFYKLSTGPDGIKREVELNRMQHRAARKRIVDSNAFMALPGKLDHATVVAYTVGAMDQIKQQQQQQQQQQQLTTATINNLHLHSKEFDETNF